MSKYISLLKDRPGYRNLWLASVVSLFGDWFNSIASLIIVNRYTETGLAISWILLARTLPRFLIGPIAGVIVDRYDRKKIMIVVDLLRSVIVLGFLYVDRPERVWIIYFLTALQFTAASFFEPSASALVPRLIKGKDELVIANVLNSITWSAMLAIGSAVGGGVTAIFGAEKAIVIDAFTFILSAILLLFVRRADETIKRVQVVKEGALKELIKGFQYVIKNKSIAVLTIVKAIGQLGTGEILMVIYAEKYFRIGQEGAGALGIMYTGAGIGAILGPLVFKKFHDGSFPSIRNSIKFGYLIIPVGWLILAYAPNVWVAALGLMIRIMGVSANWTSSQIMIQLSVPDKFLGRIFSIDLANFTLISSISIFATGYLSDNMSFNPRELTLIIAFVSIFPFIFWASLEKYRLNRGLKRV